MKENLSFFVIEMAHYQTDEGGKSYTAVQA